MIAERRWTISVQEISSHRMQHDMVDFGELTTHEGIYENNRDEQVKSGM